MYDVQFVQSVTNMTLMISKENKGNLFTGPGPPQTTNIKVTTSILPALL